MTVSLLLGLAAGIPLVNVTGADLVFTGEGKLNTQNLRGKVVIGVARRVKKHGVPVIAVVGDIGDCMEAACDKGIHAIFSINRVSLPFSKNRFRRKSDLRLTMDNLMRFIRACRASVFKTTGPTDFIDF